MIVALSNSGITRLIREVEGLPPHTTDSEIVLLMDRYRQSLWSHLENFGVRFVALVGANQQGDIGAFKFTLDASHTEHARQDRIGGLNFLRPVCVSVEVEDLPALILNPPVLAAMKDRWADPALCSQFFKISPSQILDQLERAAGKVAFGPRPEWEQPDNEIIAEAQFQTWLQTHGLKDPTGPATKAFELRKAQQQAEQDRQESFRNGEAPNEDTRSTWGVIE